MTDQITKLPDMVYDEATGITAMRCCFARSYLYAETINDWEGNESPRLVRLWPELIDIMEFAGFTIRRVGKPDPAAPVVAPRS